MTVKGEGSGMTMIMFRFTPKTHFQKAETKQTQKHFTS